LESTLIASGDSASLSNTVIKKPSSSNELEETVFRTADLRSKSASMLESFQQDSVQHKPVLVMNSFQQCIRQHNFSEVEDDGRCAATDARREEGLCSENDCSVQDSESVGILVDDAVKNCDKCGVENVEQNSGLIVLENILSSNSTRFRPWEKVHNSGNSNEHKTVLKPCQGNISGLSGNQQKTKQSVTDNDVNGKLIESTEHGLVKNGSHHSLMMPVVQNVKQKLASVVTDTHDNRQKCASNSDVLESGMKFVYDKECMSQDKSNSKNPPEHVKRQSEINHTLLLHNQKMANPNLCAQNIPFLSKETYAMDNVSKPEKICEGILDAHEGLMADSCSNEDYVRFNSLGSDRNIITNKYIPSGYSSPGHTELADVTSDMPHLLTQENLEDSVSSAAMTSSTDLNHYMNITGSSDSGSPGQEVAALYSCKSSGQDVLRSTSNLTAHQRSLLFENSIGIQNLQSSCSESNSVSHHSSLTDHKVQESMQNIVDDTVGTSASPNSVCVVEKFIVGDDSTCDLKTRYPMNVHCAICPTKELNTTHENMNCDVAKPVECLSVSELKLDSNMSAHKRNDLETSASAVSRCVQGSNNTENSLNKVNGWDILKPETSPPRLVRQNSYTLDAPSPLLMAHIKMQKEKNIYDMTGSLNISPKPCRKAWDLTKSKSKWKADWKEGNSLFTVLNEGDKPGNKINCDNASSSWRALLADCQDIHIFSLPASNASSPIKILTPFASLDSLPSAVSLESVKKCPQLSTPMKNKGHFKDSISFTATEVTNTSRTSQKKSLASDSSRCTKLPTPSAQLDCLPSVSSTNTIKTFSQPSAPVKNKDSSKYNIFSTPTKQSNNRSKMPQNKSPAKILRKDLSVENLSVASQDSLKKTSDLKHMPLSSQRDIRQLILHVQSDHHQQMAHLLAKQRLEQERLREAFLRQQEELVLEIRKVYSAAFSASEPQKLLPQQMQSSDHLSGHKNGSFNFFINPFPSGSSSRSLSFESAGTSDRSKHDVPGNCILSDANLERFLTSIAASTENGQTLARKGFFKDLVLDKAPQASDTIAQSHECSHKTVSVEEVPQNPLRNCSSLMLSDSNSTERYLPADSSHPSPEVLVAPQLDILQKHTSDFGEENIEIEVDTCNNNSTVLLLSPTYQGTMSSVPASGTVSLPGPVNHVLQRAEVDVAPSPICSSPPVHKSGSVEVNEGQRNNIKHRSPCIRQLFPPREEAGDLRCTPASSRSELEQVRFLFMCVTIINDLFNICRYSVA
jgi:hypothetical protein